MSMKSEIRRLVARSGLAVGDFQALRREVENLAAAVESTASLLRHLQDGLASSAGVDLRREFDSLATAQAEALVYLNRTLREIRSEMLSVSASVRQLGTNSTTKPRE